MMTYTIEVRDKNNKLYIDRSGKKVTMFTFEDEETDENFIMKQFTIFGYKVSIFISKKEFWLSKKCSKCNKRATKGNYCDFHYFDYIHGY